MVQRKGQKRSGRGSGGNRRPADRQDAGSTPRKLASTSPASPVRDVSQPANVGKAGSPSAAGHGSQNRPDSGHDPRLDRRHRPGRVQGGGSPWLYGLHAVTAALGNPERRLARLVATGKTAEECADTLRRVSIPVEIIERDAIEALLPPGAVHQGIALLCAPLPGRHLEEIAGQANSRPRSMVLALDQVTDPQNVGAVMRSAAAFGADALLVTDRHAPEATGALAKAASGALETVPLVRTTNMVRALDTLKAAGFWIVGLDMDAPRTLAETDLPDRCVLALGAEGRGLRRLTQETCDLMVRVPMTGAIESLNVSASAAVALYEWSRQGTQKA